ncbi:hypothetical protein C8R42DRAFT_729830 [Lentinula raphanica]|nr:hypothetical protein C8R42DRAFT_729830 [Lentinula raphanica]
MSHSYGSNNRGTDSYGSRNDNDNHKTSSYGSNSEQDPGSYGSKNEYGNDSKPYGSRIVQQLQHQKPNSMDSYIDKGVAYAAQNAGYNLDENTAAKFGDVISGN